MNVVDAQKVGEWVVQNKEHLKNGRSETLTELAKRAAKEADCMGKVSSNALRDILLYHGIETRRQSARASELAVRDAEIEKLTHEKHQLIKVLAMVASANHIPAEYKDLLFGNINQEIRDAIFANIG